MAVPTYQRQVSPQGVENNRLNPGAIPRGLFNTEGLGVTDYGPRGLIALGQGITQLADQRQEVADTAAVTESISKYSLAVTELNNKYGQMTGAEASGIYDKARDEYKKAYDEIMGSLKNRKQRAAFSRTATSTTVNGLGRIMNHESAELQKAKAEKLQEFQGNIVGVIVSNPNDVGTMAAADDMIIQMAQMSAEGLEITDDQMSARIDAFRKSVYIDASLGMAKSQPGSSEAFVVASKDILGNSYGKVMEEVQKLIRPWKNVEIGKYLIQKNGLSADGKEKSIRELQASLSGEDFTAARAEYLRAAGVEESVIRERADETTNELLKVIHDPNISYNAKVSAIRQKMPILDAANQIRQGLNLFEMLQDLYTPKERPLTADDYIQEAIFKQDVNQAIANGEITGPNDLVAWVNKHNKWATRYTKRMIQQNANRIADEYNKFNGPGGTIYKSNRRETAIMTGLMADFGATNGATPERKANIRDQYNVLVEIVEKQRRENGMTPLLTNTEKENILKQAMTRVEVGKGTTVSRGFFGREVQKPGQPIFMEYGRVVTELLPAMARGEIIRRPETGQLMIVSEDASGQPKLYEATFNKDAVADPKTIGGILTPSKGKQLRTPTAIDNISQAEMEELAKNAAGYNIYNTTPNLLADVMGETAIRNLPEPRPAIPPMILTPDTIDLLQ